MAADAHRDPQSIPPTEPDQQTPSLLDLIRETERRGSPRRAADSSDLEAALAELARQLQEGELLTSFTHDLGGMIDVALARVDQRVSKQLDQILHHQKFQKLEASWRSLYRLVQQAEGRTESGDEVQIKVLDITRNELLKDLRVGRDSKPEDSGLFEKVHRRAFNTYGAVPFAALVGDFEFNYESRDVELLRKLSGVAAAAHAPFLSAASAAMFDWQDFTGLAESGELESQFKATRYEDWNNFRRHPDSRYAVLCLPHVLVRMPYGEASGAPVETFRYHEGVDGRDHSKYLWGNAAFALAGRLVEAFAQDGWCVSISGPKGGGLVADLPLPSFKTEKGEIAKKCPTEVQITDDREFVLTTKLGLTPLLHVESKDYAVFRWSPSCHLPDRYQTEEARANAWLAAQLPYVMAASRIAHYLKVISTEDIGTARTAESYQRYLQEWIDQFVIDQNEITEEQARRKPLRRAEIRVTESKGRPGFYEATAFITPHFKFQGLSATVSLVAGLAGQQRS